MLGTHTVPLTVARRTFTGMTWRKAAFRLPDPPIWDAADRGEARLRGGTLDKKDLDRLIGANLRLRREQRCLTQVALAPEAGVSHQQLQKYETGENRIAASHLVVFARVLEVPIEAFYAGIDDIELAGDPREVARIQRAAGALMQLPAPIRDLLEQIITGFGRVAAGARQRECLSLQEEP